MQILKQISRATASVLFKLSILLFAATLPFTLTFSEPGTIKTELAASGIYNHLVDGAFETLEEQRSAESQSLEAEGRRTVNNETLQKGIAAAFPASLIEQSVEQFLDGTYRWLDGTVERPDFRIDLTEPRETFINTVADEAVKKVSGLPVCTAQQVRQLNVNEVDPFDLPCQPPDFNPEKIRAEVASEIRNSEDFLAEPVITADTLASGNGNSPFEQNQLPQAFQFISSLPFVFGGSAIILGAALVALHDERRRAIKVIARTLLLAGIVLLVSALVSVFLAGNFNPGQEIAASAELRDAAIDVIRRLVTSYNLKLAFIAGSYAIVGSAGLLALYYTRPKDSPEASTENGQAVHEHTSGNGRHAPESTSDTSNQKP